MGAIALSFTACGSGSSGDTQRVASTNSPPANSNAHAEAAKRIPRKPKRDPHLVHVALAQAHQVARCLSQAGYPMARLLKNGSPRGIGVVPAARSSDGAGGLWVAKTGLRTYHGNFYVWIAPTQRLSDRTYYAESGVPGGGERDHGHDGRVSIESERFGKHHAASVAELQTVASCAFSVPAAAGQPKWVFDGPGPRPNLSN